MKYSELAPEYEQLWATMEVKPSMTVAVEHGVTQILNGRTRYEAVSAQTGVPWFVVGLIHLMEAGSRFSCHLHNGDPLTARTVREPKGRPATGKGPFTWEDSAVDALRFDALDKVQAWDVPRICHALEGYNGWGYRRHHPEVHNPYLWSGSTHYARGKYVEDGQWDPNCVSKQIGAMPVLHRLAARCPEIGLSTPSPVVAPLAMITPDTFPKASPQSPVVPVLARSRSLTGVLSALGGLLMLVFEWVGKAAEFAVQFGLDTVAQVSKIDGLAKLAPPGAKWIGGLVTVLALATIAYARLDDARKGKR